MRDGTTRQEYDIACDGARSAPVTVSEGMEIRVAFVGEGCAQQSSAPEIYEHTHEAVVQVLGGKGERTPRRLQREADFCPVLHRVEQRAVERHVPVLQLFGRGRTCGGGRLKRLRQILICRSVTTGSWEALARSHIPVGVPLDKLVDIRRATYATRPKSRTHPVRTQNQSSSGSTSPNLILNASLNLPRSASDAWRAWEVSSQ
mmetsp:Transcript_30307/g.65157  ORF Transcript_30307/g.65157 Transcript_30307/m.65157 type:complete len:203 (+) Transcript_30307:333-941(+)|eukprot:CAMPEP_0183338860 /NCGR_PEP_ID=MMETSP0164_2-20130417/6001_1 /TAXON_ID=221442 /ORGANISM="Coccolithus pelagicus ssp braarudi, Strain PLY182g" /LENGTH=202 /DNA_ID=CAMNT_0025508773 /DNA_START=330 /DNA_END=938 /DNA_ORIENTATION=-